MIPGQHTPECLQRIQEWDQKIRDWEAKWPNYCRKCNGAGHSFYPATWEAPEESDPCDCTYDGICARCGYKGLKEDTGDGPCTLCGWNYDDARPNPWECWGCLDDNP